MNVFMFDLLSLQTLKLCFLPLNLVTCLICRIDYLCDGLYTFSNCTNNLFASEGYNVWTLINSVCRVSSWYVNIPFNSYLLDMLLYTFRFTLQLNLYNSNHDLVSKQHASYCCSSVRNLSNQNITVCWFIVYWYNVVRFGKFFNPTFYWGYKVLIKDCLIVHFKLLDCFMGAQVGTHEHDWTMLAICERCVFWVK